jgi:hypothetical protein
MKKTDYELIAKSMMQDIMVTLDFMKKDAEEYNNANDTESYAAVVYSMYNLGRSIAPYAKQGKLWFPANAQRLDELIQFLNAFNEHAIALKNGDHKAGDS